MLRIRPFQTAQVLSIVSEDEVFSWMPLPTGSVLHGVSLDVQLIASVVESVLIASPYAITGYVVPVPDPDAAADVDAIWDQMITKDATLAGGVGADIVDMDHITGDANNEVEWGEPNLEDMLNVSQGPVKIFSRSRMITFARSKGGFDKTAEDYRPTDEFVTKVDKKVFVDVPSMAMFAISQPAMSSTSTAKWEPTGEAQWMKLQYMGDTLIDAFKALIGTIEAGAVSPYADAEQLLQDMIEQLHEQTTGAFGTMAWRLFNQSYWDFSVPGTLQLPQISSGHA